MEKNLYLAVAHAMGLKRLPLAFWLALILLRLPPFHSLDDLEILLLAFFVAVDLAYSQIFVLLGRQFRRTQFMAKLRRAVFWAALVCSILTECSLVVWSLLRTHESAWFGEMAPGWKAIALCLMPWLTVASGTYAYALMIRHPGPLLCFLFVSTVFLCFA